MQEVEITIGRLLRIVWLIFWRGAIGALLIGAIVGFVVGFIMGMMGFAQHVVPFMTVVGLLVGLVWWPVVVKMALQKHYGDFRIALIAR